MIDATNIWFDTSYIKETTASTTTDFTANVLYFARVVQFLHEFWECVIHDANFKFLQQCEQFTSTMIV